MSTAAVIATIFLPLSWLTGFFGQNFGQMLDRNREAMAFLQRIDTIEVDGDQVVVTPLQGP